MLLILYYSLGCNIPLKISITFTCEHVAELKEFGQNRYVLNDDRVRQNHFVEMYVRQEYMLCLRLQWIFQELTSI
jgi:hypothetical protein